MAFDTIGLDKFHLDSREDSSKSEEENSPSILYTDLTVLTGEQRISLASTVLVLCILSICGNLGALYANRRRKLRLFFRTCLISLALSDLITTVFMAMGYLAQFKEPSVQMWCIGGLLCKFIPFVTTGAILVSSFTLVGIAMDRYLAVMGIVLKFWNPNKIFCMFYTIGVWGLSFGIAGPMYSAYSIFEVYVIASEINSKEKVDVVVVDTVKLCISEKESNAYYYVVVLTIIFVPTLIAFVWLNSIIANKLWIRRHSVRAAPSPPTTTTTPVLSSTVPCRKPAEKQMEMIQQKYPIPTCDCQRDNKICSSSTLTVPTSLAATTTATRTKSSLENDLKPSSPVVGSGHGGSEGNSAKHISSREARHLRMFTIVLILMAVFIFFRLPAWIFLIMRMYGTYTRPVHWILHFSFGILTLTSCVLNPLLYTFLAETIQYGMFLKAKLCGLRRYFGECGMSGGCCFNDDRDNEKMSHDQIQNQNANQNDYNEGDNCNDDGKSNDGAKSTSRKTDDDSV